MIKPSPFSRQPHNAVHFILKNQTSKSCRLVKTRNTCLLILFCFMNLRMLFFLNREYLTVLLSCTAVLQAVALRTLRLLCCQLSFLLSGGLWFWNYSTEKFFFPRSVCHWLCFKCKDNNVLFKSHESCSHCNVNILKS